MLNFGLTAVPIGLEMPKEFPHIKLACQRKGALSSVVEHYLHTVGVAGSKPAARTIFVPA